MDPHVIKIATGGDEITLGTTPMILHATLMVCTNELKDPAKFEGLGRPALGRRIVVLNCDTIFSPHS